LLIQKALPAAEKLCGVANLISSSKRCLVIPFHTSPPSPILLHSNAIASLFEQIVLVCHEEGLIGNELFAINGCKTPSDASKEWSGTFKELAEKRDKIKRQIQHHMDAHQKQDILELDDDERKRRRAQAIETLNKAHDKIDEFLNNNEPRQGESKNKKEVKSNITDNEFAKMTTSTCAPKGKGTIQGYNGLGTADKKYQVIIDAQVFGSGSEQHTLSPIIEAICQRFNRLGISHDIFQSGTLLTADTGFASEENMAYLHNNQINAYIPDNQFRSRDPKFQDQKVKYPKPSRAKHKDEQTTPANEFIFDVKNLTCQCPTSEMLPLRRQTTDKNGSEKAFFEGKVSQCRNCERKHQCMRKLETSEKPNGRGRQVSFMVNRVEPSPNFIDWMKVRVDSEKGKEIYGHRMSVIDRKSLRAFSAFPPSLAVNRSSATFN